MIVPSFKATVVDIYDICVILIDKQTDGQTDRKTKRHEKWAKIHENELKIDILDKQMISKK